MTSKYIIGQQSNYKVEESRISHDHEYNCELTFVR